MVGLVLIFDLLRDAMRKVLIELKFGRIASFVGGCCFFFVSFFLAQGNHDWSLRLHYLLRSLLEQVDRRLFFLEWRLFLLAFDFLKCFISSQNILILECFLWLYGLIFFFLFFVLVVWYHLITCTLIFAYQPHLSSRFAGLFEVWRLFLIFSRLNLFFFDNL